MLRNVLEDYLSRLTEREFDLLFLALLPNLGFYDIHFTHGHVEFGKDVIAKYRDGEQIVQYSFQLKAGDIQQAKWRNELVGQMMESVLSAITHPNFDDAIPHQPVLVATGELKNNAAIGLNDLNKTIIEKYERRPILFWGKDNLLDDFSSKGAESLYKFTNSSVSGLGSFFILYGNIAQSIFSEKDIELQSRQWIKSGHSAKDAVLGSTVEGEIIARKCIEGGYLYEAFHAYLGIYRTVLFHLVQSDNADEVDLFLLLADQIRAKLIHISSTYLSDFLEARQKGNGSLGGVFEGIAIFYTYPVHLMRLLELSAFLYFLDDSKGKDASLRIIIDLIQTESASAHVPSDRYAISIVLPVLALIDSGKSTLADKYLTNVTVWLCDRFQEGLGLARFDEDEKNEVAKLLGSAFDFIQADSFNSFLATVIGDLVSFSQNAKLYTGVINDLRASNIFPCYWQPQNSLGLFDIEGEDVITYPNVQFEDDLNVENPNQYAGHIVHEIVDFDILRMINASAFVIPTMLLLRDRYFPLLWSQFVNRPLNN